MDLNIINEEKTMQNSYASARRGIPQDICDYLSETQINCFIVGNEIKLGKNVILILISEDCVMLPRDLQALFQNSAFLGLTTYKDELFTKKYDSGLVLSFKLPDLV